MILEKHSSIQKKCLLVLIITGFLVSALLAFVSIISIRTGFSHIEHTGFWVPVLSGMALFAAAVHVLVRAIKRIRICFKTE